MIPGGFSLGFGLGFSVAITGLKLGERRINRTVTYVTSAGKLKPAIVTAVKTPNVVDLRIGHHGETYTDVVLMSNSDNTSVWYRGTRRRFLHS